MGTPTSSARPALQRSGPIARRRDLARDVIDHGLTQEDLGPRRFGGAADAVPRRNLAIAWPDGTAPRPDRARRRARPSDPLPRADVLVITWTVAELRALADVLTPGVDSATPLVPLRPRLRELPADASVPARRPGSPDGWPATTPPASAREGAVPQVGAAPQPGRRSHRRRHGHAARGRDDAPAHRRGAAQAGDHHRDLRRDLPRARARRRGRDARRGFLLSEEFPNEPFANQGYRSDARIPRKRLSSARRIMRAFAANLTEPAFAPPSLRYPWSGPALDQLSNTPVLRIDGDDFDAFHPILSTDSFIFGTTGNGLQTRAAGSRWATPSSAWCPTSSAHRRRPGWSSATSRIPPSTPPCRPSRSTCRRTGHTCTTHLRVLDERQQRDRRLGHDRLTARRGVAAPPRRGVAAPPRRGLAAPVDPWRGSTQA